MTGSDVWVIQQIICLARPVRVATERRGFGSTGQMMLDFALQPMTTSQSFSDQAHVLRVPLSVHSL